MAQITGKVRVRVDGEELKTVGNGSGTTGGVNRSVVKGGGRVHGYTEEVQEPTVSFTVAHQKGVSVRRLANLTGATVLIETDTGERFIYRDAWTTEPPELNHDNGEISVSMAAVECEEDG